MPAAEGFRAGRDFAAWLGLTSLQKSTGGKKNSVPFRNAVNGRSTAY
jgi:hypothetical protein